MKRLLSAVLMIAALTVVFAGCGKKDLVKIKLNEVTHSVFYAPQYVALSQGFFKEEGLEVELTNGAGADKVMTAVLSWLQNETWGKKITYPRMGGMLRCRTYVKAP